MSLRTKSLPLEHQWFIYALQKNDVMMEDTALEVVDDLGDKATDFQTFAQAAFDLYTASFSPEDQLAAQEQFQEWMGWAMQQNGFPDFKVFESATEAPSSSEIAKALDELRSR